MQWPSITPGVDSSRRSLSDVTLAREAYGAYRRREAKALLALLPREAVRPFYASARRWARESGEYDPKDPMVGLLRYCEHLLPLPPFELWRSGFRAGVEPRSRPRFRRFPSNGTTWTASLGVAPAGSGRWKGFIRFQSGPGAPSYRTSDIFREQSPEAIGERFEGFDLPSLRAFLRSVTP